MPNTCLLQHVQCMVHFVWLNYVETAFAQVSNLLTVAGTQSVFLMNNDDMTKEALFTSELHIYSQCIYLFYTTLISPIYDK